MGFKLTVFLCLIIAGAMYFAPVPPELAERRSARQAAAPEPAARPEAAEPEPAPLERTTEATPAPPPPVAAQDTDAAVAAAIAEATSALTEAEAEAGDGTDDAAPLSLGTLSLGSDGVASLSLAESVRQRTEAAQEANGGLLRPVPSQPPLLPGNTAPTDGPDMAQVIGSAVNLRAGPSTGDAVVGRVSLGQQVEVLERVGTAWAAIRDPGSGGIAYISSQFLDPLP
jgi:hypothetical protein